MKNQLSADDKKHFQSFAINYYFVFRLQLENAELIEKILHTEIPQNSLLSELAYGYIGGSVSEFVLMLYDSSELLKKVTGTYKYDVDGAIAKIFKFRRHFLAHRGCNWGSEESRDTINYFTNGVIYKTCHESAIEFIKDLCQYMTFDSIQKNPMIQQFRAPEFNELLKNSPALEFQRPIYNIDDVKLFFW